MVSKQTAVLVGSGAVLLLLLYLTRVSPNTDLRPATAVRTPEPAVCPPSIRVPVAVTSDEMIAAETPDHGLDDHSGASGSTILEALHTIKYPPLPHITDEQYHKLPRFAVISFVTGSAGWREAISQSAMSCYCASHGYPFYIETARLHAVTGSNVHFNKVRALMKYLRFFQWVLFVDGDVVPHNRSMQLTDWLDDRFHFISNERINGESWPNPFVRNTAASHVMLQQWMNYSYAGVETNGDNGPYLDLLMRYADEPEYERAGCPALFASAATDKKAYPKWIDCYQRVLRGRREFPPHWKWYRPQVGFMRASEAWANSCYEWLLPGDVLGHGKGRKRFTSFEDVFCLPIKGDVSKPSLYPRTDAEWERARKLCRGVDHMPVSDFDNIEKLYRQQTPRAIGAPDADHDTPAAPDADA